MSKQSVQRACAAHEAPQDRSGDLVARVCAELGFTAEDAALVDAGEPFVLPSGLVCRLLKDELEPRTALRPELDLPLLLEDLELPQLARLLDLQTVLVSTTGWTISADPEEGQLCLSTLLASTASSQVVKDLASGSVLALSALQMLVTDPAGDDAFAAARHGGPALGSTQ